MNEHPILFSTPMVKAICEGRKTQTRRIIKPQPDNEHEYTRVNQVGKWFHVEADKPDPVMFTVTCPYGVPGDHLWVRETWAGDENTGFAYKASEPDVLPFGEECIFDKWKPSIFMPRTASRITLEVVNVRIERLQDISDSDAVSEGVDMSMLSAGTGNISYAQFQFSQLWDYINEKRGFGWDTNPLVWVVEFKRLP